MRPQLARRVGRAHQCNCNISPPCNRASSCVNRAKAYLRKVQEPMSDPFSPEQIAQLKKDAVQYVIPHFASNAELAKGPKIFVRGEGCYLFDDVGF